MTHLWSGVFYDKNMSPANSGYLCPMNIAYFRSSSYFLHNYKPLSIIISLLIDIAERAVWLMLFVVPMFISHYLLSSVCLLNQHMATAFKFYHIHETQ